MTQQYTNDINGKRQLVNDYIKPLLLSLRYGWVDVIYEYNEETDSEIVICVNANSDKTKTINVSWDSLWSMVGDIMRGVYNLDYK